MNYSWSELENKKVDFGDIDNSFFLVGLLNGFMNRMQAAGDTFFKEISWKQCFVIICVGLFRQPPTINELAEFMGCSHQNIKQMVLKLEKAGFLIIEKDKVDKRKQRIVLTEKTREFNERYDKSSKEFMNMLYKGISEEEISTAINVLMKMSENLKNKGEI